MKFIYKRNASLYFALCIDSNENELDMFNVIHSYVELLDRHFGSVCELDIVFQFQAAYQILDEFIIAGHLQESSQEEVMTSVNESEYYANGHEVVETLTELGLI